MPDDGALPLPVIGMGSQQGQGLARLAADAARAAVALRAGTPAEAPRVDRLVLVVGADDRRPPEARPRRPRRGARGGLARPGPGRRPARGRALTGTSAAAAEVAARALRLRIDRPELGPRAVHSLLVQAAAPLDGVSPHGARAPACSSRPARPRSASTRRSWPAGPPAAAPWPASCSPTSSGRPGRYAVSLRTEAGEAPLGGGTARLGAGGRVELSLRLPAPGAAGTLVVRPVGSGEVAARAPVLPARPARTPADALSDLQIRADSGLAEILVRVGTLRREDGRVRSVRLHGLRLELVPADGGAIQPVAGTKQAWAWPAGTYRFLVARRLASGVDVAAGTYRVRVTATGPDDTTLRRESGPFTLD